MASGGTEKEPVNGKGWRETLILTSVHKAMQGTVGGPHQVDQAGLAVADGAWLWNSKAERLDHGTQGCPRLNVWRG